MRSSKPTCFYCADCDESFDNFEELWEHTKTPRHILKERESLRLPVAPFLERDRKPSQ